MPIPKAVAAFNKRVTNRITGPFAGRLPGFAVVTHVGRSSGRHYRTPVNMLRRGADYVFVLTYGPQADWVRNVEAAGSQGAGERQIQPIGPAQTGLVHHEPA